MAGVEEVEKGGGKKQQHQLRWHFRPQNQSWSNHRVKKLLHYTVPVLHVHGVTYTLVDMHDWNVRLNTGNTLQPSYIMGTTRLLGLGIDWSTWVGFKPACLDMYVCGGSITKTMTFFWIYIARCTQFLNSSFLGFLFWHSHHDTNLTLRNWLHTRSVRKQQWRQPRTPLRTHFTPPRSMQSFLNPLSALLFIFLITSLTTN